MKLQLFFDGPTCVSVPRRTNQHFEPPASNQAGSKQWLNSHQLISTSQESSKLSYFKWKPENGEHKETDEEANKNIIKPEFGTKPCTIFNTLIDYCGTKSTDRGCIKRIGVTSGQAKHLIMSWICRRIASYQVYISVPSIFCERTFSDGVVVCALAHSYNPFAFELVDFTVRNPRTNFALAWSTFRDLTGSEPIYSLDDLFNFGFDSICFFACLSRLREQLEYGV